jgi:hypothetical protein
MRKEDALRHARECFQWAATTRDPKNRAIFLDAAKIWELLAQDSDVLDREGASVGYRIVQRRTPCGH